jgi:hypothetical protein
MVRIECIKNIFPNYGEEAHSIYLLEAFYPSL